MIKTIFIICTVLSILLVAFSGCNLQKMVKVDAPKAVLEVAGVESMTVADTNSVLKAWQHHVEMNTEMLSSAIDDADQRYQFIRNLTDIGIGLASDASEGLPYGGFILAALAGAAGLVAPQPKFIRKKTDV